MKRFRRVSLSRCSPIWMVALGLLMTCPTIAQDPIGTEPLVVFIVRHAEKEGGGRDPGLSEEGKARANVLAGLLRDAGLQHIHSSDFARTRGTAQPIAERLQLTVETYDPRKLESLAAAIQQSGGRHLVVGHSNTTPELVRRLGGRANSDIDEQGEFDRLYVVSVAPGSTPSTILLRYGQPFAKSTEAK